MTDRSKQMRAGLGIVARSAVLLIVMAGLVWVAEGSAGLCNQGDGAAGGWATAVSFAVVGLPMLLFLGLWRTRGTGAWPGILLGWVVAVLLVVALLAGEAAYVRSIPLGGCH
ncbi:hypothetical protein [Actinoplanes sp. NPDC020271]|uniref:hypothetical protein n=1 Tax=Actinoplanes sp. NPDC020271 TaxID=3363896 RepID=UPI0037A39398